MLTEENSLAEIVSRAQRGNRIAFDRLISHFEGKVLKTALYLTRNLHDAQDIAQEVYIKIFRNIHRCRDLDRIDAWVYRIAINETRNFQRRKKLFQPLTSIFKSVQPCDPVIRGEIRNRLTDSLAKLSFNERAVFIFKALEDMKTDEVAEILNCSIVTVRTHLHNARKKLKHNFHDFRETLWTD